MKRWRGNLSEIKILFQYRDFISNFCGMAESSDNFGCLKKFQTLIMWMCYISDFESPYLEICNISFIWRNIRGKLPYTAMQESVQKFLKKSIYFNH